MRYFDLHCDSITGCCFHDKTIFDGGMHVDLTRTGPIETYVQCYAAWIPDNVRGEAAFERFSQIADRLQKEISASSGTLLRCHEPGDLEETEQTKKHGAVLTVENGAALGGDLSNIVRFKELGVRMCTLTWNGENELGRGVMAPGKTGLSEFGRQAIPLMEQAGIVIDISHASPELFYDVAELAKTPLVASHSNAKAVCSHPRNLTDEQFEIILSSGGLVGLNYYNAFLNNEPDAASMEDILKHAEHFLSLGGENALAMGSDFDGAQLPDDMKGLESIPRLYEMFLKHYKEETVDKIFYGNASSFFKKSNLL